MSYVAPAVPAQLSLAELCALLQVCAAAAAKPMWQLRGGRLVHLRDGCFLQAAPKQLGSAALDIIQSTMPVFNAPWHVKEALEAAGVPQLTSTTPGRVRFAPVSRQPSVHHPVCLRAMLRILCNCMREALAKKRAGVDLHGPSKY